MEKFSLLDNTLPYRVCDLDLAEDADLMAWWLEVFRRQIKEFAPRIKEGYCPDQGDLECFEQQWEQGLKDVAEQRPCRLIAFDRLRDALLRRFGWPDPYQRRKDNDTEWALRILPEWVESLSEPDLRKMRVLRGLLAGNLIDMGHEDAVAQLGGGGGKTIDFHRVLQGLGQRPWLIDHADDFLEALTSRRWRKAVVFVDNAGPDFVLGILPLSLILIEEGLRVVLAANEQPSLNDITLLEAARCAAAAGQQCPQLARAMAEGDLQFVSTGGDAPLLDFDQIRPELNAATRDADLIILEGMGRALESNRSARFRVDCLRIAMIKDESIARWLGGKRFDLVCELTPAGHTPPMNIGGSFSDT